MNRHLLQQLYVDYGKEIRLYLYSLCKSRDMAEDLMQETFEKALLSLPDHHTNMRAWLYLVARNLCFNAMKREKRYTSEENVEAEIQEDILGQLIQREQNQVLYHALMELPSRKREILQLQYFGGLSLKEIARVLQISPENVRVLSCRARKELKRKLEEEGYEI